MRKILCLLLALLMIIPCIACATSNEKGNEQTEAAESGSAAASENESETGEELEVDVKDFNCDINFLVYSPGTEWDAVDIFSEGESKDLIKSAINDRNGWLLDTFGITVKEFREKDVDAKAKIQFTGGSSEYDAYVSPISSGATMASNGYLMDLKSDAVPGIDLSKSWWDQRASDGFTINDRLFFATGDLLTIDNDATFIMMFNKSIIEDNGLDNPYELVGNYEWTLEKCNSMMALYAKDKDGDGFDYKEDNFGLAGGQEMVLGFFYGSGLTLIGRDGEGELYYALESSNVINKADEYFQWAKASIYNNDLTVVFHEVGEKNNYKDAMDCFVENRALFYGECLQCVTRMRSYDINFGVIPYPQFDANQKTYYGYVNNIGQVVSIPQNCSNLEMAGTAIEAMSYKSQSTLTPAYYDKSLIAKGTRDAESEPMLEIILANRVYDLGYIFGWGNFGFYTVAKSGTGASSSITKAAKSTKNAMNKTLAKFDKIK